MTTGIVEGTVRGYLPNPASRRQLSNKKLNYGEKI
jgi:hypothetical protein